MVNDATGGAPCEILNHEAIFSSEMFSKSCPFLPARLHPGVRMSMSIPSLDFSSLHSNLSPLPFLPPSALSY